MIRQKNVKYYAPIVFFLLMLIDSHLTQVAEHATDNIYFPSAHFMLLAFLMAIPNLTKRYLIIAAIIIGLLCDSYYIGIIGIYVVALTTTVMLMYRFKNIIHTNMLTAFFGMVIFVTTYELISVSLQVVFQLSNVSPLVVVTRVMGPTLLLNMVLFIIFAYPMKRLFAEK